ncbi:MFS transporter [Bradyrhizobium nitroreducens]|uniref:MFS transporter n=1 Tax=Bradyrhizobium nitroreducens TaxID=709803 RepID=UPI001374B638|nr:MFS transporter [Bradyrhizobium nitroreducens]
MLILVLGALDQTILGSALPVIARDLSGGGQLSWIFSSYLIASVVVIPLYGKAADVYGRKPILVTAVTFFLVGSLLCGFSATMGQLILARAVQGAGAGGLLTLTMLGLVDLYPADTRPKYQALLAASYGLATMFGPLIGGALVQTLSWRWAFFINVPGAAIAIAILARRFPRSTAESAKRIDFLGAALLASGLACTLLATRYDPTGATSIVSTPILVALSAILLLTFLFIEARAKNPILPLVLFSDRVFCAATVVSLVGGVALFAAVVFLPLYLQTALQETPLGSALHLFPLMLGITLAAVIGGRALRASGRIRGTALAGGGLVVLGSCGVALFFGHFATEPYVLSICTFPVGLGIGLLLPLVTVVSQRTAPREHIGIGTATPIMVRALGGAIGVAIIGYFLKLQLDSVAALQGSGINDVKSSLLGLYQSVFASSAERIFWGTTLFGSLAILASLVMPNRFPASQSEATIKLSSEVGDVPVAAVAD